MRKNFITLGSFDGAHLGHRHLIYAIKDLAALHKMQSMVLVFDCPPRVVMEGLPAGSVITSGKEKLALLRALKPGRIAQLNFEDVRGFTPRQFFDILLKKYKMGGLLAGPDFAFGKGREGHLGFLRKICAENSVIFMQADFVTQGGHKISSSLIRRALKEGDVAAAARLLGRPYRLSGKIIKGQQLGRKLGFPTANIDVDPLKILPRGVYAVRAYLGKEVFKSVCNIGIRPTISKNGLPSVEAHLLNFDRNIYGRVLAVDFIDKIRDEKRFNSLDELKAQISQDSARAAEIL